MIEDQLKQFLQGIITHACSEAMNRNLIPLLANRISESSRLLTYTEVMTKLHISKPTFFRLLRENRLRKVRIDKRTFRVDPVDLQAFIDARKQ